MRAKCIDGFDGRYTVYEDGRIYKKKGNDRRCKGHFIKSKVNKNGYAIIDIQFNKVRKVIPLHRILAASFIPNPENKKTVNHKDGNKLNNSLLNLEWNTHKENNWHSRHVLFNNHNTENQRKSASNTMKIVGRYQGIKNRKFTMQQANVIRSQRLSGVSVKHLANHFGASKSTIIRIINNTSYV